MVSFQIPGLQKTNTLDLVFPKSFEVKFSAQTTRIRELCVSVASIGQLRAGWQ